MPVVSVGEKFPDLQFETYAGKTLRVSEVVAQKKHTLFWVMRFIGCRFCQYDLDELAKVYGSFEARDAQVFAGAAKQQEFHHRPERADAGPLRCSLRYGPCLL